MLWCLVSKLAKCIVYIKLVREASLFSNRNVILHISLSSQTETVTRTIMFYICSTTKTLQPHSLQYNVLHSFWYHTILVAIVYKTWSRKRSWRRMENRRSAMNLLMLWLTDWLLDCCWDLQWNNRPRYQINSRWQMTVDLLGFLEFLTLIQSCRSYILHRVWNTTFHIVAEENLLVFVCTLGS